VTVGGDLHGNIANFRVLVELADLPASPNHFLVLQELIHGSARYPNGGDPSHRVLDLAASLVCQYPKQVIILPGNHELSELTGRSIMKDGVALNHLFALGLDHAYGEQASAVMEAYHELFRSLPLAVQTENRVMIVHTIPSAKEMADFDTSLFTRAGLPLELAERGQSLYSILWGRDHSEEASRKFRERMSVDWLICGHIAQTEGVHFPNAQQLVLDSVGRPAGYAQFSADQPLNEASFRSVAQVLS
jgi:hypothetical protein